MPAVSATRQRALSAALEVFSQKGYEAASMGDIAGALGIKAPSLYKYFKGKEELYEALGPMLDEHYTALWASAAARHAQLEREIPTPGLLGVEQLERETMSWLQSELDDPQARCFRRLMALSQFEAAQGPDRWLWAEPLELYEGFFARLISRDILRRGDPRVMAVEYLAPILQCLAMIDRDPGRAEQCLEDVTRHIHQFHRVFAHREQRPAGQSAVSRLFRR